MRTCEHCGSEFTPTVNREGPKRQRFCDQLCRHRAANRRRAASGDIRKEQLKRYYNMTFEQYEAMWLAQEERCACCGTSDSWKWVVDHDHSCCAGPKSCGDCVRAILCQDCNIALGCIKDNPDTALKLFFFLGTAQQTKLRSGKHEQD